MNDDTVLLGEPPVSAAAAAAGRRVAFPDLGAIVHLDEVPPELLDELPGLYSSAFSTAQYFAIYDRPWRICACELDEPRHVLVFTSHGATADVLNKVIDIEPSAVERLAAAIFRARPEIRRIRAEIKFPPRLLELPVRKLYRSDDQVVESPASRPDEAQADEPLARQAAFERHLGSRTRKHLHTYRNRMRRSHPEFNLRTLTGAEITLPLVEQVFDWNRQRIRAKGEPWLYEGQPEASYKLWRLLQTGGEALCGYLGDDLVAAHLRIVVGRECWVHTAGYDPAYLDLDLGSLMAYYSVADAMGRGFVRTHLLWGTVGYKQHLGARPVTAYRISLYRSRLQKALYGRERWLLLMRDRHDIYWTAHEALKQRLPVVVRWHARLKRDRQQTGAPIVQGSAVPYYQPVISGGGLGAVGASGASGASGENAPSRTTDRLVSGSAAAASASRAG